MSINFLCVTLWHMSICTWVIISVTFEKVYNTPCAQTCAQGDHKDLSKYQSRLQKMPYSSSFLPLSAVKIIGVWFWVQKNRRRNKAADSARCPVGVDYSRLFALSVGVTHPIIAGFSVPDKSLLSAPPIQVRRRQLRNSQIPRPALRLQDGGASAFPCQRHFSCQSRKGTCTSGVW